jgi:3,4-dihydroxy 2-butanone 4-phosphate synthase/GTP cyclohydrolase II
MRLISNNPKKRTGLVGYGLEIVENVPLHIESNPHNAKYLATKKLKMGHTL